MRQEWAAGAIACAAGLLVWLILTASTGKHEAWDSELYFVAGLPVLYLAAAALGYRVPRHAWRWGVLPFATQMAWMMLTQPPGALAILGLGFMAAIALPGAVAATLGGKHRLSKDRSLEKTT